MPIPLPHRGKPDPRRMALAFIFATESGEAWGPADSRVQALQVKGA
jgi:hypothetical protein